MEEAVCVVSLRAPDLDAPLSPCVDAFRHPRHLTVRALQMRRDPLAQTRRDTSPLPKSRTVNQHAPRLRSQSVGQVASTLWLRSARFYFRSARACVRSARTRLRPAHTCLCSPQANHSPASVSLPRAIQARLPTNSCPRRVASAIVRAWAISPRGQEFWLRCLAFRSQVIWGAVWRRGRGGKHRGGREAGGQRRHRR